MTIYIYICMYIYTHMYICICLIYLCIWHMYMCVGTLWVLSCLLCAGAVSHKSFGVCRNFRAPCFNMTAEELTKIISRVAEYNCAVRCPKTNFSLSRPLDITWTSVELYYENTPYVSALWVSAGWSHRGRLQATADGWLFLDQ